MDRSIKYSRDTAHMLRKITMQCLFDNYWQILSFIVNESSNKIPIEFNTVLNGFRKWIWLHQH